MTQWLAVKETRIDVRRTSRDGHGGYPVGSLYIRHVLATVEAPTRADARAMAPREADIVVSVPSLRISDPNGWLQCPVGVPVITESLRFQSQLARELVAQRRAQLLAVA
jgi:hypothetical protein